jgi:hypothetical protein
MASCGNESSPGFRAFLPDCRAYEMVTPPYLGGGVFHLQALSPEGDHAIVHAFSGLAETENVEEIDGPADSGAFYELSRTPAGWQT